MLLNRMHVSVRLSQYQLKSDDITNTFLLLIIIYDGSHIYCTLNPLKHVCDSEVLSLRYKTYTDLV